jgi:ethanolamine ammonia-lyase large subunit
MFSVALRNRHYTFQTLNELLGKANEERSGDRTIGLAAHDEKERVAAQRVLADVTLETLYENPAVPYERCEVTRTIVEGVDGVVYTRLRGWTVGGLREFLLASGPNEIRAIQRGLTAEMIAAAVKLCSNMDLVAIAQKVRNTARARTTLGLPGVLSSRLQPNHPADSVPGILAVTYEGLAYGSGDCLIGVNPAIDSVESVTRIAAALRDLLDRFAIPTCTCVLAHVTTQMEALNRGAPLDIMFQSIAGTEATNRQFGVTAALLKEADALIRAGHGGEWPNVLYFETGQGSELSLDSHEGVDQVTLEARTYGFAKAFSPYMVNNVSGFIGPEILYDGKQMIRANLEDLCMGKLAELPMGMAPCYTTHAEIDQNDHEIATMLLALGGSAYFMGIAQNDDVMLSYQDTSFHDDAALRRMLGLRPNPEFERWMESIGLLEGGEPTGRFGDARVFH